MRLLVICSPLLLLAACDAKPDQPGNAANAVNEAANSAGDVNAANAGGAVNYIAAIDAMTDQQRQGTFFRAIRDADLFCREVTKVEKLEPMGGVPTWRASCDQGAQHLIQVKPDGNAQVISRKP